jgi:hypothetical protein
VAGARCGGGRTPVAGGGGVVGFAAVPVGDARGAQARLPIGAGGDGLDASVPVVEVECGARPQCFADAAVLGVPLGLGGGQERHAGAEREGQGVRARAQGLGDVP